MDALQKVFDTIMEVLNMIKAFLGQLFPQADGEGENTEAPQA